MTLTLDISRHKELFNPYYFHTPITIIGAGATGSWLTLALAKLGIEDITVWDFDIVEEHNIANQAFFQFGYYSLGTSKSKLSLELGDIGKPKVEAIKELVEMNTGIEINTHNARFTNQRLAGIVFLMVDSMKERKRIWEESIKMRPAVNLLIEPRMGLDVGRIYNIEPMNLTHIKRYEDTYYDDDVAEVSACGASKTVISTALGIASWCARQLINWHNKEELDNEILIDFKFNNIFSSRWE